VFGGEIHVVVDKGAVCLWNGDVWKQRQQREWLMTPELRRLEERGRWEAGDMVRQEIW
jgi:hypothetical protein